MAVYTLPNLTLSSDDHQVNKIEVPAPLRKFNRAVRLLDYFFYWPTSSPQVDAFSRTRMSKPSSTTLKTPSGRLSTNNPKENSLTK